MANKYQARRRSRKETQNRSENPFAAPRHGGRAQPVVYTPPPSTGRPWLTLVLCCVLVLMITLLYVQTARHEFTVCDDNVYIYEKPQIIGGFTQYVPQVVDHFLYGKPAKLSDMQDNAIVWAFADSHEGNWHPLTWISHMIDWQLFSGEAGNRKTSVTRRVGPAAITWSAWASIAPTRCCCSWPCV